MNDFILHIFPVNSLDHSVITTTWVGVMVCVFFNLRFGWTLSGLVVPGYLVPLVIIKPWSAAVIGIEGLATYAVVWLFSEFFPRFGWWGSLFGRDRFFALILVSIAIRLSFDGWLLPVLGEWVVVHWGLVFDYRNNLHSVGLVVVALLANQFWKPGFVRGVMPAVAMVGLTWLIVRFGLMEFTNFRISDIGLLYEDLAESFLSTPKAYIVLMVTAFLASRLNLRYGWDFNGILIPSLLALQWYQPAKILTSIMEAFIILGLASLLLRLPIFANAGIEGARKLLLFFNVGFAYKMALAAALPLLFPEQKITDYFGFGYLLSTLIALKIHDKEILARLTLSTIQTSVVGAGMATIVGFGLTLVPPLGDFSAKPRKDDVIRDQWLVASSNSFADLIHDRAIAAYAGSGDLPLPPITSIGPFEREIHALGNALRAKRGEAEKRASAALREAGFSVREVEGKYLVVEAPGNLHWGTFVLDRLSTGDLILELPDPLEHRGLVDSALGLAEVLRFRGMALAGVSATRAGTRAGAAATGFDSLFHAFHRAMGGGNVLQIRAHGRTKGFAAIALRQKNEDLSGSTHTALWVKAPLPPALDLSALSQLIGTPEVIWGQSSDPSLQGQISRGSYAELYLSATDLHRLVSRSAAMTEIGKLTITDSTSYLRRRLLDSKGEIAAAGTDLYRAPRLGELMYLDAEVVGPLVALIDSIDAGHARLSDVSDQLRTIALAATRLGLRLTVLNGSGAKTFLMLAEDSAGPRRHWGTVVFRLAGKAPVLIQVPKPLFEANTLEAALALFDKVNARGLVIAGADSRANQDGSADLLAPSNMRNMLNLVSQVVLRDTARRPVLVVQVRGFGGRVDLPPIDADAVMSSSNGVQSKDELSSLARDVLAAVELLGLTVEVSGGDAGGTTGLAPGSLPQMQYLDQVTDAEIVLLWLSPSTRERYRLLEDGMAVLAAFDAVEIGSEEAVFSNWLSRHPMAARPLSASLRSALGQFVRTGDVVGLWNVRSVARKDGTTLVRLVDVPTRKVLVAAVAPSGETQGIAHLSPLGAGDVHLARGRLRETDRETIEAFVEGRSAWLLPKDGE